MKKIKLQKLYLIMIKNLKRSNKREIFFDIKIILINYKILKLKISFKMDYYFYFLKIEIFINKII